MSAALQSDVLVPSATILLELALFFLLAAVLVLWPLVTEAGRRRWEWVALLVLLGPLAGVVWWVVGRRAAPVRA